MKLHWGNGILIFIILFLVILGVAVIFSLRQNNDLVEKDYYEKGADYTHQMEMNKRSVIYQDSISIYNTENYIVIKASANLVATSSSLYVYFFRPSDKEKDYKVEYKGNGDSMLVDKSKLAHGRYLVKLSWEIH